MIDLDDLTRGLAQNTADLNEASDALNAQWNTLEAHIAKLRVNVYAEVPMDATYRLCWAPFKNGGQRRWRFAYVMEGVEPATLTSGPRELRVRAAGYVPDLLREMKSRTAQMIADCDKAAESLEHLLGKLT